MPLYTQPGQELGYAEITANPAALTTGFVDVTGLTITVTTGGRPIMLKAHCPYATNSLIASDVSLSLYEGASVLSLATLTSPAAAKGSALTTERRLVATAGSHTYNVKARITGVGSGTLFAGATFPMFISCDEV